MPSVNTRILIGRFLPQLAVTVIICSMLCTNTTKLNNNTSFLNNDDPLHLSSDGTPQKAPVDPDGALTILSAKDTDLYRAAFAAQAKGDCDEADAAIAGIEDDRLMGHVLADRYQRRGAVAPELASWLQAYRDLPEAPALYSKVGHLGGDASRFEKPKAPDAWGSAGGERYAASLGFKTDGSVLPDPARRLEEQVDARLHHNDPTGAEDFLNREGEAHLYNSEVLGDARGHIAAGYFFAGMNDKAEALARQAGEGSSLALWIEGLSAWKTAHYRDAATAFEHLALAPDLESSDRAAAEFWAYRSDNKLGLTTDARAWLNKAATDPHSFYGVLAVSLTGRRHLWSWSVPSLTARRVAVLRDSDIGARALALIEVGQRGLAESELRRLDPKGNQDLQEAMLAVAETNHLAALEVQLGGLAAEEMGKNYDAAFYPVPSWKPVEGFKVDRALLYALMRRESYFNPAAVSGRGACGLMQLMPQTAHLVSQGRVSAEACSGRMLDPAYNLALGQTYVRRLEAQPSIGTNLLYLLAAYNGGPGNLARWTAEGSEDPLLFIESLPIHETRDYVQQVLLHYWTYRARLNETNASMAELARGEWPHPTLRDEGPAKDSFKDALQVKPKDKVAVASRDD